MIDGLKPYPEYKDSGVPWLGDVPGHWEVKRGKTLFGTVDIRSKSGDEELLTVSSNLGVTPRRLANVTMFKAESYAGHKLCWPGDLVINSLWAWARGLGVSRYHGIVSTAYGVYRTRDARVLNPRFVHELVRSTPFHWELRVRSKGVWTSRLQLTDESFLDAPFPLPPLSEQTGIARFLDHADRRIRRYIRAKQKLTKLLEEQKQAIIHRAVTRGLDPNVRLKPSGVEWLGDVPEHWGVSQVRRLISFVTSGSRGWAEFYRDEGDIFLQSGNLGRSMALNLSFIQRVRPPDGAEGGRTRVERDDLLICITGALTGNVVHVVDELPAPSYVNQHVALIRPNRTAVIPRYLAYALHSEIGRIQFKSVEYGGTKQGLGLDDVKSALIPIPTRSEQTAICAELDATLHQLAASVDSVQREIALLREYRTRLIADLVTGKLDVREAAARLPDEPDGPDEPEPLDAARDADGEPGDDLDTLPEETLA
jgi:type I restriction enzyme S subunit